MSVSRPAGSNKQLTQEQLRSRLKQQETLKMDKKQVTKQLLWEREQQRLILSQQKKISRKQKERALQEQYERNKEFMTNRKTSRTASESASTSPHASTSPQACTPLDATSVLADRYVPQHLRAINHQNITTPMVAVKLPSLDPEALMPSLVPPIPTCYCKEKHEHTKHPVRTIPPELRFALLPTNSLPQLLSIKEEKKQAELAINHVDGISVLSGYFTTFEKLLQEERAKVLILYERYSQFNVPVTTYHGRSRDSTPRGSPNSPALTASCSIRGIADARPALQTGDHVLFRPMRSLSLPDLCNPMSQYWGPPHHTVEIDAQVRNVKRNTGTKKESIHDVVATTWLDINTDQTIKASYPAQSYNIRFIPSTKLFERCLTALDWLSTLPPKLAMDMLFPNDAPVLHARTNFKYDDLNEKQATFVNMVRLRTAYPNVDIIRPPMLLTGPAGTGKTKTMLKSIMEVLKSKPTHRILVCAPSHSAADVVTTRLGTMLTEPGQILRLYDSDRPVETVPIHLLAYCRQCPLTGTFALPAAKELLRFSVIVCTCSDAHLLYRAGVTNSQLRMRRRCFKTYMEKAMEDCNLSTGPIGGVDEPRFTHLFIDEAAQATEPETLIPLSVVVDPQPGSIKAEIVLVGDPRQLSPNVYSTIAADCGLGRSFLERLLQRPVNCLGGGHPHMLGPTSLENLNTMQDLIQYSFQKEGQDYLSVFLTMNYRGHPSFLMMPSTLFYFDKLQSAKSIGKHSCWVEYLRAVEALSKPVSFWPTSRVPPVFQCRKQSSWPMHFRGIVGQDVSVALDSSPGCTDSWSNQQEAEGVVNIVVVLQKSGVSSQAIGIMAPFRAQVVLIRKLLREKNLGGVNVGTIEDYQAVERDVIVLSLTRSNPQFVSSDVERRMGVFQQLKRTNVALTRAENLFIVVGNPLVMAKDPIWRQWLWFCCRNGLWYGDKGGSEITDWFAPNKVYRSVRHRPGIDSSRFLFSTTNEEPADEDDIVMIGTLERNEAPRELNDEEL
jgi:helicase MOV-10